MSKGKIALVCFVVICAMGVYWIQARSQRSPMLSTYSQFLDYVRGGRVANIVITETNTGPARAVFKLKAGDTLQTVLPSAYRDSLLTILDKQVSVEIRDGSAAVLRLLTNAFPFLLLLAVWMVLMARIAPNGPRRLRLG
jgi:ATP-dependent Zn protease